MAVLRNQDAGPYFPALRVFLNFISTCMFLGCLAFELTDACGGLLEAQTGEIHSPLYPELYPTYAHCVWEIKAKHQSRITLRFTSFQLESNELCKYDNITINSALVTGERRLHGIFCGTLLPPSVTSETNYLRIEFKSDQSNQFTGFKAVYSISGPQISGAEVDKQSYAGLVVNPMGVNDLEYFLDFDNEIILNEFDFVPNDTLDLMSERAMAHNTTPKNFIKEIQQLVSSRSHLELSPLDFTGLDEPQPSSSVPLNSSVGTSNSRLRELEIKYNITANCSQPNSITYYRLVLMFPNFLNLGQKPLAKSLFAEILGSEYVSHPYNYRQNVTAHVPMFFTRPEFAGLIPRSGLGQDDIKKIIVIHMFSLYYGLEEDDSVPLRTKCGLVKLRMEKSLMPDTKRIRYLQNNAVLTGGRVLKLKDTIEKLYKQGPDDFETNIFWEVFNM